MDGTLTDKSDTYSVSWVARQSTTSQKDQTMFPTVGLTYNLDLKLKISAKDFTPDARCLGWEIIRHERLVLNAKRPRAVVSFATPWEPNLSSLSTSQ